MDLYPLNLILAIATASATIFLGFLPTKNISSTFFANETGKAILAWGLVAVMSSSKILHFPIMLAFFCFAAWWNFGRDRALSGKMWLSVASGLGISIGVMTILAVTPQANPPGLPQLNETLLLASIYLGSAIIGLAYVCFALVQGTNSGVTQGVIQRYVGLLFGLTLLRAAAMLASAFLPGVRANAFSDLKIPARIWTEIGIPIETVRETLLFSIILLILTVMVLPALAFLAKRATEFSSRIQPTRFLIAIMFFGFMTEFFARIARL